MVARLLLASLGIGLASTGSARADNVLLVVLDDVGVDRVRAYGESPGAPATPTLDALASAGVLFRNCWANPYCSPTRATLLTGRYGYRTGIGDVVTNKLGEHGLSLDEWILPEVLRAGSGGAIRTAAIGKWHLGGPADPPWNALAAGFELYSGQPQNLGSPGEAEVWTHFTKLIPGSSVLVQRYATTDEADDALRAIEDFGDEPWFLLLAFHAAHQPYHAPPPELHGQHLSGDPEDAIPAHHKAAVQAIDTELGRLLASLSPAVRTRTHVLVVGDNGTQGPATEPPFVQTHGKGTLFEGGVHVPLLVAGPAVAPSARGRVCTALVETVDLFTTSTALLGVDARAVVPAEIALDGASLVPYLRDPERSSDRPLLYAEWFRPNHAPPDSTTEHRRAARGPRFKLIRDELEGSESLFDLALDPYESRDLLEGGSALDPEQRAAWHDLRRWLDAHREASPGAAR